jgi:4-hydroxymandelate oxidase
VAPTAFHRLAHPDGELATARAAARAGTAMVLSTLSTTDVEEVAAQGAPVWFQLYVYRDRGITAALVERAAAAGCRAIVLTADASILGTRERDVRNRFHLPAGITIRNAAPPGYATIAAGDGSGLAKWVSEALDPGVTWKDVEWLRSVTTLPILLKGVVRADDAARAADCGAAGIVVSNHGGRQLDGSPATADVLAEVVDAARGLEVLVDGGIRRGTDVLKALSLGARAVLVGRPVLWGLAVGGEDGVARVLAMLRDELDEAMALAGCPTVADATRDLVASAR